MFQKANSGLVFESFQLLDPTVSPILAVVASDPSHVGHIKRHPLYYNATIITYYCIIFSYYYVLLHGYYTITTYYYIIIMSLLRIIAIPLLRIIAMPLLRIIPIVECQ